MGLVAYSPGQVQPAGHLHPQACGCHCGGIWDLSSQGPEKGKSLDPLGGQPMGRGPMAPGVL